MNVNNLSEKRFCQRCRARGFGANHLLIEQDLALWRATQQDFLVRLKHRQMKKTNAYSNIVGENAHIASMRSSNGSGSGIVAAGLRKADRTLWLHHKPQFTVKATTGIWATRNKPQK